MERNRTRLQANATLQYYVDRWLGGRHEFRFGFDHTHAVTENLTRRIGDVQLTYTSATNTGQNVTLYSTPLHDASALDVTSLYFQDSYSLKRLTLVGGLRYERLEGYLPEQTSQPSAFFPNLQREFAAVRDVVLWHTAGPRFSAIYDLQGDGRTALKASWGRYYYVLSTGGGGVSNVNLNATYSEQYNWNDANRDLVFQPGEQTGTPVITSGTTTSIDPDFKRPYTDELSLSVDRQLIGDLKLSAAFTYRREKNIQVSANPDNPYATTPSVGVDPGLDGLTGTADDGTFQYFDRLSAANRTLITNDPTRLLSYKGLEITGTKRLSNRWQMLAGYTLVDESSGRRERRYVAEPADQHGRRDHDGGERGPSASVQADGLVPAAVSGHPAQRELPFAERPAGDAPDQPAPRARRQPDDQPGAARQHAAGSAEHDRSARVEELPHGHERAGGEPRSLQPDQRQHGVGSAHADAVDHGASEWRSERHAQSHPAVPVADAGAGTADHAAGRILQVLRVAEDRSDGDAQDNSGHRPWRDDGGRRRHAAARRSKTGRRRRARGR